MGWGKFKKKVTHAVKKVGKEIKKGLGGDQWWIPGYGQLKGMWDTTASIGHEYHRNEGTYNRMAAIIGGSILTGGLVGAAAGAAGLSGASFATGAASGAITGGISAGTNAAQEYETNKALEEQEKIAQEEAAKQAELARLAELRQRGGTPEDTLSILYANNSAITSQHRRNQKSRQSSKTLGAGNSTLS